MLNTFAQPRFSDAVIQLAQAYGKLSFWLENLTFKSNPDAAWRALMVLGALGKPEFSPAAAAMLPHPDSRVRAWACFALGQMKDEQSLEQIHTLNSDPSHRVRFHAWQALQAIVGPEESERLFPRRAGSGNELVLISEDALAGHEPLSAMFTGVGLRPVCAATEAESLRLALELHPEVILTDNQKISLDRERVDNLSGLNLTHDVLRQPELRETIIFMYTADAIEPAFLWHGGDFYLSKYENSIADIGQVVGAYLRH